MKERRKEGSMERWTNIQKEAWTDGQTDKKEVWTDSCFVIFRLISIFNQKNEFCGFKAIR
jgi:hypothetical protein